MRTSNPQETLVPDGQYRVAYVQWERFNSYGDKKYSVTCTITEEGESFGLPIYRYYNEPTKAWIPRSHNLWLDYTALIPARPPRSFTPDLFLKGCEVLAETATVKHQIRGRRRIEIPQALWYSKIDRFIRITSGSPPCMRSRG